MDRMGCTGAFLDAGLRAHGATLRSGGAVLGRPSFDDVASAYNFALMIPQRDTERLLAAHLDGFGVRVEREAELVRFAEVDGRVEALLRNADGRQERVEAAWLIGCDGAHSTVRHGLGLPFSGSAQGDDWVLADVRLEGEVAPPPDEIATYLHRDGPFVVFPIPAGRARVIASVGRSDPAHPKPMPTLEEVQALVDERAGGGFRVTDPVWLANFRINERKVAEYRYGRVFLAGDAAHIHSPAGGQGMNTGIADAINLAWKLATVVKGQAADSLLDSYEAERQAFARKLVQTTDRLFTFATAEGGFAAFARTRIAPLVMRVADDIGSVRAFMFRVVSQTMLDYHDSPLSAGKAGTVSGGDRLPFVRFEGGDNYGSLSAIGWQVHVYGAARSDLRTWCERHGVALHAFAWRTEHGRAGLAQDAAYLLRPDTYVALADPQGSPEALGRYFSERGITPTA